MTELKMERLGKYKATFTYLGSAGEELFYIRDVEGIEGISHSPTWVTVGNSATSISRGKTGRVVEKDDGAGRWMLEFYDDTKKQFHLTDLRRATDEEIAVALPKWAAKRQRELDEYNAAELLEAIGRKGLEIKKK